MDMLLGQLMCSSPTQRRPSRQPMPGAATAARHAPARGLAVLCAFDGCLPFPRAQPRQLRLVHHKLVSGHSTGARPRAAAAACGAAAALPLVGVAGGLRGGRGDGRAMRSGLACQPLRANTCSSSRVPSPHTHPARVAGGAAAGRCGAALGQHPPPRQPPAARAAPRVAPPASGATPRPPGRPGRQRCRGWSLRPSACSASASSECGADSERRCASGARPPLPPARPSRRSMPPPAALIAVMLGDGRGKGGGGALQAARDLRVRDV